MSEFTQFDSVKSMIRYLPPKGTAGFARTDDRIERRSPSPPARITAMTGFGMRPPGLRAQRTEADASTATLPSGHRRMSVRSGGDAGATAATGDAASS